MSIISKDDRFSAYSLWDDLNRVLVDEVNKCENSIPTYRSPTGVSCQTWMREIGEAIKSADVKTATRLLDAMAGYTQEAILFPGKYPQLKTPEEHNKPFEEFFMASHLLMIKLTGQDFR